MKINNFYDNLNELVRNDIKKIRYEQGGEDGMYSLDYGKISMLETNRRGDSIIERIYRNRVRGFERYVLRIYVLSVNFGGGVCIMGYKDECEDKLTYTIFHLGEDDAIFSMRKDGSGGINCMNKIDFVDMVSRALSLLNNNK